jgi:hypothetical protein
MDVSLNHDHRHTDVHITSSDVSAPSALSAISPGQTVEQDKEQIASTGERPNQQKMGKKLSVKALSRSSLRPGEKRVAPQGRYSCGICKLDYTQPQGLKRHQREKHNSSLCMYCCEFAWGRPYLFREHLVKRHPGIDPNVAIIKATRTRQSPTIRRYLPQQRASIPADEHNSWGGTESQAHPNLLNPPLSTVANHAPIFPPNTPSMTYDLQPKDDHTTASSTEEGAQPATNLNVSTRAVHIWLVLCMPMATLSMISDPSTTISGFRTGGRRSAELDLLLRTVHQTWRLHLSSRHYHLLVDMVEVRSLRVPWLSHLDTRTPVILRLP